MQVINIPVAPQEPVLPDRPEQLVAAVQIREVLELVAQCIVEVEHVLVLGHPQQQDLERRLPVAVADA